MDKLLNNKDLEQEALVFKALAHPSRLQIVLALYKEKKCVNDLREIVGGDISTISRHISVLKNAGIVIGNKTGLHVFYSLEKECVIDFINCIKTKSLEGQEQGCCQSIRGI